MPLPARGALRKVGRQFGDIFQALAQGRQAQVQAPQQGARGGVQPAQAAVWVMEKEGITQAFGIPGAAINPLYSALRKQGTIGAFTSLLDGGVQAVHRFHHLWPT